ncbi:glutamine amidotransferase [soil metagenome]
MTSNFSLSLSPIGPWALVIVAAVAVTALTIWPYHRRLRHSADRRKWVVLGLRLVAVLLCFMATMRPSVLLLEKVQQRASILFLTDSSSSMKITDEADNASRWEAARKALELGRSAVESADSDLDVKAYRFDVDLVPDSPGDATGPDGPATALGDAILESTRREQSARVAAILLFTDGSSNMGIAPLTAAQRLRSQGIPVVTVGFGSAAAGAGSRDVAVTALRAAETVFVKNELDVRGTLRVRGYPGQELDVSLWAEGESQPVDRTRIKVPEGTEIVPVTGLSYTPQTAGEKLLTLRVAPMPGELIPTNNEYSTYVTVLSGGLNVLHLQGPGTIWEGKFVSLSLDKAQEIQSELKVVLRPAQGGRGALSDEEFAPGRYDVYILGDLPADFLTPLQQKLLAQAVERGAGLIMLGGRDSFGDGGWGNTALAEVMPTIMRFGDGQIEPDGGLRFLPNPNGLESYVLQVGSTPEESASIWESVPTITGASRLGSPKPAAVVWADTSTGEPLMVRLEPGAGRTLAFGGETWPWYRAPDETSQAAHRRFWRQAILWLARKEDEGERGVELRLDRRRLAIGQGLGLTAVARDEQDAPIPDARYEATINRLESERAESEGAASVDMYTQGNEARGSYYASGDPGQYTVSVVATDPSGQEIGRASSRFLVYQDDRELENPAANIPLLQQIAELTGGQFLRPEQLERYFAGLDPDAFTRVETQVEYRLWDNWPFLLLFVSVLGFEWWLRKRMGWV